jgi:hypothetical protein
LPDVDESTIPVDIFDFKVGAFRQAQSTGLDRGQANPIAQQPYIA